MKLSDAIRLGAMLHRQCQHSLELLEGGAVIATCALGAAKQAGYDLYQLLVSSCIRCPACLRIHDDMFALLGHLNDFHGWTREQIADWVATVEPAETTTAANAPVDVRGTTDVDQPVLSIREA